MQLAALALESQVVTSLPASEHEAWEAKQVNHERAERMLVHKQALPALPTDVNLAYHQIESFAKQVMRALQIYK